MVFVVVRGLMFGERDIHVERRRLGACGRQVAAFTPYAAVCLPTKEQSKIEVVQVEDGEVEEVEELVADVMMYVK